MSRGGEAEAVTAGVPCDGALGDRGGEGED